MAITGRPTKNLPKERILEAMEHTRSNKAASRYLGVSYYTYKKYAKLYVDKETGMTLHNLHKNYGGKGVKKFFKKYHKIPDMIDIIEGRYNPANFDRKYIKLKLLQENYLKNECYSCGFNDRRVLDHKIPLLLHFKNENKHNYRLENMELLCYNCYFLNVGDIFNGKDIDTLETNYNYNGTSDKVDMELEPYQKKRLKELFPDNPSENNNDSDDDYNIVSRL